MAHVVLLNLVFFVPAAAGAAAFALLVYRFVASGGDRSEPDGPGPGTRRPLPSAGPDDLVRSA